MSEKTFAELLERHIRENGYTNYEVAKAAKINRVNLQRYISGARVPSEDIFEKIASVIPMSHEERDEFREAYEFASDGRDTYYLRKCIREMLEKVEDLTGINQLQTATGDGMDGDVQEILIIDGALAVEQFICGCITNYMNMENERHVLLYLPADKFFPGRIFPASSVDGRSVLAHLKITQMIPLSKRADRSEDEFYNLCVLRNLIPLYFHGGSNYETCYYYQKNAGESGYGMIYPYYGIFDNCVLLFSKDMNHAVRIRNWELVGKYRGQFLTAYGHAGVMKRFVTYFKDSIDMLGFFMEHDVEQTVDMERCFIEYQPCFALAADKDLIASVIRSQGSYETNVLLQGVLMRREIIRNSARIVHYFTKTGLEEFIETGVLAEYPENYVRPLTVKERIQAIDSLLAASGWGNIEFGMIRDECLYMKKTINVYLSSACGLTLILNDEKQEPRHMQIDEPSICHAFRTFINQMAEKRDVFSMDETRNILREKRELLVGMLSEKPRYS